MSGMRRLRCCDCKRKFWTSEYRTNTSNKGRCSKCLLIILDAVLNELTRLSEEECKILLKDILDNGL